MVSLITQLAAKLGESIEAQLLNNGTQITHTADRPFNMSQSCVKFIMQSDAKESTIFTGDDSDKFIVHEWENLMTFFFLKKQADPVQESRDSSETYGQSRGRSQDKVS